MTLCICKLIVVMATIAKYSRDKGGRVSKRTNLDDYICACICYP